MATSDDPRDAEARLRGMLAALRGEKPQSAAAPAQPASPAPPSLQAGAPAAPQPPAAPISPQPDEYRLRLESLEQELLREREGSRSARAELERLRLNRAEVEQQIQASAEQLRRERHEADVRHDKERAQLLADALQKRSQEMQDFLLKFMSDQAASRQQEPHETELRRLAASMQSLSESVERRDHSFQTAAERSESLAGLWELRQKELEAMLHTLSAGFERVSAGLRQSEEEARASLARVPEELQARSEDLLRDFAAQARSIEELWLRRAAELESQLEHSREEAARAERALKDRGAMIARSIEAASRDFDARLAEFKALLDESRGLIPPQEPPAPPGFPTQR
ncbi:MAG: hypothetical protein WCU88_00455 [Elusimicrobiota bacterium]|jgi:hypothetical protein